MEGSPRSTPTRCKGLPPAPLAISSMQDGKAASKLREELAKIQQSFSAALQRFDSTTHGDKVNQSVVGAGGEHVHFHLVPGNMLKTPLSPCLHSIHNDSDTQTDRQRQISEASSYDLVSTITSMTPGHHCTIIGDLSPRSLTVKQLPTHLSRAEPMSSPKGKVMTAKSTFHDIKSLDLEFIETFHQDDDLFDFGRDISSKGSLFAYPEDMVRPTYHVEDYYYSSGFAQAVARSDLFGNIMLVMSVLNSIYLGIDAELNPSATLYNAPWAIIITDNLFCLIFWFEWMVRFRAFRGKCDCLKDSWFCFDSFLVLMMVVETWIVGPIVHCLGGEGSNISLQPLRLLRLLRLSRVGRIVRNVPELATMAEGLSKGARACIASLGMIFILTYVFAVAFHSLLGDDHAMNAMLKESIGMEFRRLTDAMWLLLVCGTFMLDGTPTVMNELYYTWDPNHQVACYLFITFLFLSAMVICNMLIGVLCSVVTEVARNQRDSRDIGLMKESVLLHLQKFGDGDGMIARSELEKVMNAPHSKVVLNHLKVDRTFLMALQQMFFKRPGSQVPIKVVMELMLSCRGDQPATVHTVANSLAYLASTMVTLEKHIVRLMEGRTTTQQSRTKDDWTSCSI